jgi:hypothetical protein
LDRQAVITLALLYFVRDEYPDEEEPYVKIAQDLLRTEFGVPADRVAELNRIAWDLRGEQSASTPGSSGMSPFPAVEAGALPPWATTQTNFVERSASRLCGHWQIAVAGPSTAGVNPAWDSGPESGRCLSPLGGLQQIAFRGLSFNLRDFAGEKIRDLFDVAPTGKSAIQVE